jgi:segregation and condensation protein B
MRALVEALLFVSGEPLAASDIASHLGFERETIERWLEELVKIYDRRDGGIRVVRIAGGYQMATLPELAEDVGRFLAAPTGKNRLSKAAMETVAIIAYRQPITQAEIEAIRGVNTDGVVGTLVDRELVAAMGRKDVPGRPILYGTTPQFLHYFGMNSLHDLPPLEDPAVDAAEEQIEDQVLETVGLSK